LDITEEKKEEVVRKYRVFHMKEFHNTYSSPIIVGMIKSISMERTACGMCSGNAEILENIWEIWLCMGRFVVHLRELGWCTWSSDQSVGWTVQGSIPERHKTCFYFVNVQASSSVCPASYIVGIRSPLTSV
jgi:hypothetical protein